MTLLEAMGCGCAVVSTRNQGADELIIVYYLHFYTVIHELEDPTFCKCQAG
ncbi:MAG: hypothetical protein M1166_00490 [Candidatus Thermoplasmatota archaeon]|nr:hypothetical protein [Candidatus Thermoplasmatota archaeon]